MKLPVLFFCLSLATACAQNITVQVGGKPVGSATTLNFQSGSGARTPACRVATLGDTLRRFS
jgi:hypothetical protein